MVIVAAKEKTITTANRISTATAMAVTIVVPSRINRFETVLVPARICAGRSFRLRIVESLLMGGGQ